MSSSSFAPPIPQKTLMSICHQRPPNSVPGGTLNAGSESREVRVGWCTSPRAQVLPSRTSLLLLRKAPVYRLWREECPFCRKRDNQLRNLWTVSDRNSSLHQMGPEYRKRCQYGGEAERSHSELGLRFGASGLGFSQKGLAL